MSKRVFCSITILCLLTVLLGTITITQAKGPTKLTFYEFLWYLEDVKQNGIPKDAVILTDANKVRGAWKCLIDHDPYDKRQEAALGYAYANIVINGNNAKICLDNRYIKFAREAVEFDLSKDPDSIYKGTWQNGQIQALGPGNIKITKFYSKDGFQYAIGEGMLQDGSINYYALVRP